MTVPRIKVMYKLIHDSFHESAQSPSVACPQPARPWSNVSPSSGDFLTGALRENDLSLLYQHFYCPQI